MNEKQFDVYQELDERRLSQAALASRLESEANEREAEEKRLVDEKVPCPHCGTPLVTDDNHRVRLGRGFVEIGHALKVKLPDVAAVFDGCVECFTRPALHWESMIERVYDLEATKIAAENQVTDLTSRIHALEGRVVMAVGTLQLRWITVGLGLACWEVLRLVVTHVLAR